MKLVIILFIVLLIGLLPVKKYLSYIFYPEIFFSEKIIYNIKKTYLLVGQIGFLFPLIDFLKPLILYYCLIKLSLKNYLYFAVFVLIILWCYGNKKEAIINRGTSFFLGIFFIIDLSLFQLFLVIYASILLLTRYQSAASFILGIVIIPVIMLIDISLFKIVIGSIASYIIVSNYKNAFIKIFSKTFFHLSH